MKIYIETYGCALNKADSNLMVNILKNRGYQITNNINEADVIILNTCTVRKDTELRIIKRLKYIVKNIMFSKLVIAGCMARAQPFLLHKLFPKASLISPQNIHKIHEVVESEKPLYLVLGERDVSCLPLSTEGVVAYLPIAEGCLGDCAFCITKIARRSLKSYNPKLIIESVKRLISNGVKEIDLTAQDTGVYGYDLNPKWNLPKLLSKLIEIPGDYMIRIGMANPRGILDNLDEFIEVLNKPKIFKFVHIPLQSGDDKVLKIMRRDYTVDDFKYLIRELKRKVLGITIATDVIVGHPGEDEEAFENTVKLLKELQIDRVHVAQYTIRPRTLSASLPQVPEGVKKRRSSYLINVIEELGSEINKEYMGSLSKVLMVKKGFKGRGYIGRLYNYKTVVISDANIELGKWVNARITGFTFYDLRATLQV